MYIRQNRRCAYALKAMLDLSERYGTHVPIPISDISGRRNIPMKYLEQIMLVLKGNGYVDSRRGAGGGFLLVKPPIEIALGEIAQLFQTSVSMPFEEGTGREQVDLDARVFHEVWERAERAVSDILDNVTFLDAVRRTAALREKASSYTYHI